MSKPDTEQVYSEFAHDFLQNHYDDRDLLSLEELEEQIENHAVMMEADDMVLADFKPQ